VTSLSFLKQILQDVRHQKVRTLLTLLGITWGTVSVALLMAFGEGLEKRIKKNQHGLGENIVIAWPARTALPWQGLGKGRRIRVSEDDIEALRREIPEADFSGEHEKDKVTFRRERVRLSPEMSANNPIFAAMRSLVPAPGGRYINDLDIDRRRRVVFLGDKLKDDLFGKEEAVGKTVMIDNVPFLVIGVMQHKEQDSSYSGRDVDKAFVPESTYKGLFTENYVSNFIFQAKDAAMEAYRRIEHYDWAPIVMEESLLECGVRMPSAEEVAAAKETLEVPTGVVPNAFVNTRSPSRTCHSARSAPPG